MAAGLGSQHSPPPRSPKSRPLGAPGAPSDAWSLPGDVAMSRSPPPSPMTGRPGGMHHLSKSKEKAEKSAKAPHRPTWMRPVPLAAHVLCDATVY